MSSRLPTSEMLGDIIPSESYEAPQELPFLKKFAEELLTRHEAGALSEVRVSIMPWIGPSPLEGFNERSGEMASLLEKIVKHEDFDADSLLRAVVETVAEYTDARQLPHFNYLFDPLLQALYTLGFNDFTVDLTPIEWEQRVLGYQLRGTEERPLSIIGLSHLYNAGSRARHCRFTHYGYVGISGHDADYSEFLHHVSPQYAGIDASCCTFFLPSASPIFIGPDIRMSNDCSYDIYKKEDMSLKDLAQWHLSLLKVHTLGRAKGFFKKTNNLTTHKSLPEVMRE